MKRDWLPSCGDVSAALQSITASEAPAERWIALRRLAAHDHDIASLTRVDNAIRREIGRFGADAARLQPVRLALLGTSTISHLAPGIRVAGLARGLLVEVYEPAYAQARQELANPSSGLHGFSPDAVLFATDPYALFATSETLLMSAVDEIDAAVEGLRSQWRRARETWHAIVVQQIPFNPYLRIAGENEARLPGSAASRLRMFQQRLRDAAAAEGVDVIDLDYWAMRKGLEAWHVPALWYRSKQDVHPAATPFCGDLAARVLAARYGKSAKCLVLDLDNTLWGGVIGDDGITGIVLGQGSAGGESFVAMQAYAKRLAARGVILAVCSKNDDVVARQAFEEHPEMVLRLSDIGCFKANWQDKAGNLKAISATLNIGTDALVFVDDNPRERALVRRELPDVMVPELDDEPANYPRLVADSGFFESVEITEADLQRTELYQAKAQLASEIATATDLDSYLASLEMKLRHAQFDSAGMQRIVQLINKTNQFNLRTRRYSEPEVAGLLGDPNVVTLQLRLLDRFGDNGIIGAIVGKLDRYSAELTIETWLMSCRVLGRQVEQATLNLLVEAARERGATALVGEYIPTDRNAMVADHYEKLGFMPVEKGTEASRWRLDLAGYRRFEPPIIEECMP